MLSSLEKQDEFEVIVIGGGHAGVEAVWACANLGVRAVMITMDPKKIGAMSCNPAIGGLAKGQMVREIDALGGLMGLATDATGIQFRMLNLSKGPAVWGPRAQCDKYAYAREVQRLLGTRKNITILAGTVEKILVEPASIEKRLLTPLSRATGVEAALRREDGSIEMRTIRAGAVVLTTGTFMRGLMHTGERKTQGGRVGEGASVGISGALRELGFEIGRLKTGTPPRLDARTIDFASLPQQPGDEIPVPFSDLTDPAKHFPVMEQKPCWITQTCEESHVLIRANLHRAPMYNGQIETQGPRYCPSIEDKVVRFIDRHSHHVYLEPESLETNEIYCNGISTSLPEDVQEFVVHHLPGCENAKFLKYGYAVEYDMVWPHQIDATGMTKVVDGLFLAGQINGTSGYEEAAGQGLLAGLNAVRFAAGKEMVRFGREQAYIGVLMDDLVTKTPREPYRMFTSRAEHRLLLRSDNADTRLTPLGRELGLVHDARWHVYEKKQATMAALKAELSQKRLLDWAKRPEVDVAAVREKLNVHPGAGVAVMDRQLIATVLADIQYAGYIDRQHRDVQKLAKVEQVGLPVNFDYRGVTGLRTEACNVLTHFRPTTLGQASRLAGVTPADVMLLTVALGR